MLLRKLDNYIRDLFVEKIEINYVALKYLDNDKKVTDKQRKDMWTVYHVVDGWVKDKSIASTFDQDEHELALMYSITYHVPRFRAERFKSSLATALIGTGHAGYNWNYVHEEYYVYF